MFDHRDEPDHFTSNFLEFLPFYFWDFLRLLTDCKLLLIDNFYILIILINLYLDITLLISNIGILPILLKLCKLLIFLLLIFVVLLKINFVDLFVGLILILILNLLLFLFFDRLILVEIAFVSN